MSPTFSNFPILSNSRDLHPLERQFQQWQRQEQQLRSGGSRWTRGLFGEEGKTRGWGDAGRG